MMPVPVLNKRSDRVGHDLAELMNGIGRRARAAARKLALASAETKNVRAAGHRRRLRADRPAILPRTPRPRRRKAAGQSPALVDRLTLDDARIAAIADGVEEIAALPDPVGRGSPPSSGRTGCGSSASRRRSASSA